MGVFFKEEFKKRGNMRKKKECEGIEKDILGGRYGTYNECSHRQEHS